MTFEYKLHKRFDCQMLVVKNEIDDDAEKEIVRGNYEALWLYWGVFERMVDILSKHQLNVKFLLVHCFEKQDITWINQLNNLNHLTVGGHVKGELNFDNFKHLNSADLEYSKTTRGVLSSSVPLRSLLLSKSNVPLNEYSESLQKSLEGLHLSGGNLQTIDGVDKFIRLTRFTLVNLRKLVDISSLSSCKKIERLDISSCNRIKDVEVIGHLSNLRRLIFENKSISSLSWLPRQYLDFIELGDSTTVEDMNVEVLTEFPVLRLARFSKRKGYKYNAMELKPFLKGNVQEQS